MFRHWACSRAACAIKSPCNRAVHASCCAWYIALSWHESGMVCVSVQCAQTCHATAHTFIYHRQHDGSFGGASRKPSCFAGLQCRNCTFFLRGLPQGSVPRRRTRLCENRKEKKSGHTICTSPGSIETYNIPGDIYANIGRTGCHTLACLVICCVFGFFFILFDSSTDTGGKMLTVTPGITHGAPRGA